MLGILAVEQILLHCFLKVNGLSYENTSSLTLNGKETKLWSWRENNLVTYHVVEKHLLEETL